jgi:hypothetical protein
VPDYPLKGGYVARDPRLGRVPEWDPRNAAYPIRALLEEERRAIPSRGRTWPIHTRLDQLLTPRCVGYSSAQRLATLPKRLPRGAVTTSLADELYFLAQDNDQWPGRDYDGTSILGGLKAQRLLGLIDEYRWCLDIDDLVETVATRQPVLNGTVWLDSMMTPRPSGLLDCSGSEIGGHAYETRGVRLKANLRGEKPGLAVAVVAQTWGPDWGVRGEAYILIEDVERLVFRMEGECGVPIRHSSAPVVA